MNVEDHFQEERKKRLTSLSEPVEQPKKSLPDWNKLYSEVNVKDMPWYLSELDPDLKDALNEYHIESGTFFDLGTGPGTQAIELSKRGFRVTGSDLSENAILKVQMLDDQVKFIQDDILHSKIDSQFDYILDRGCFHIIDETQRLVYVSQVVKLINKEGLFFLKCFSDKNPDTGFGPHHISETQINEIFSGQFTIVKIKDSLYHSNSSQQNRALFVVMKKK